MNAVKTQVITEQFGAHICMAKIESLTYAEHLHPQYELVLVLEGCVEMFTEDNRYHAVAGDLVFINSMSVHCYYSDDRSRTLVYGIYPQQVPQFTERLENHQAHSCMVRSVINDDTVRMLIDDWSRKSSEDGLSLALQTNLLLSRVMDALETAPGVTHPRAYPQPLRDALAFIEMRLPEPVNMAATAEEVGVSPYYLSHLFGETLQISFSDYVAMMRVNAARRMLVQTGLSVADIAGRCGYTNQRTFNRNFTRVAGITPSEYRDAHADDHYVDYSTPFLLEILRRRDNPA